MTTVYLPEDLLVLIDKCSKHRMDSARSITIRYLLLRSLAELGYVSEDTKRALGL